MMKRFNDHQCWYNDATDLQLPSNKCCLIEDCRLSSGPMLVMLLYGLQQGTD